MLNDIQVECLKTVSDIKIIHDCFLKKTDIIYAVKVEISI